MRELKNILIKIVDTVEEFFLVIFEKIGLRKIVNIYRDNKEGGRYLVFGGLTTILNILLFKIFTININLSTTVSNIIAWIFSVIFAYITNKLFVFFSTQKRSNKFNKRNNFFFFCKNCLFDY